MPFRDRRTGRLLLAVVLVCGLVRVVHLLAVYRTPIFDAARVWPLTDMYIFDQWALRIVEGDVLGRARYHPVLNWMADLAPAERWTRWFGEAPVFFKAPLYAYLVALMRWLFGDAALPMAIVQILASTGAAVLLFLITRRLFGATAGLLTALVFSVYGPAVHYDAVMLRGPWIVLVSLLVTWCLMRIREEPSPRRATVLGLVVGVSVLLSESFLTLPLLVLAALAFWSRSLRRWATLGGWFLAGLAIALAPLVVRNVVVGVPPLQVAATGAWVFATFNARYSHPILFEFPPASFVSLMDASDARLGRLVWLCLQSFDSVGQIVAFYLRRAAGLIAPFENPDNANYYYAVLRSPLLEWLPDYAWLFPVVALGAVLAVGRARGLGAIVPVAIALLLSNLLAPPLSRYRLTLIILMMPFAGLALQHIGRWMLQRRIAALAAALVAMLAFRLGAEIVEQRVVFAGIRPWQYVYRLSEFQIAAQEYAKEGRLREASEEYLLAAAHDPHGSSEQVGALLRAAPLQALAGDADGARATLRAVREMAPTDPRVLLMIGDVYWKALDDTGSAAAAYRSGEDLQPTGIVLETLRARQNALGALPAVP